MPAKILAFANQKGGCGKTTLAMNVAGTLGRRGAKVLVVDADPQGTATQYAAAADEASPFPVTVSGLAAAGDKIHREIRKYVADFDYIVIDCPPAVDAVTPQSALLVSDVAVIPIVPSPADLWAAVGTRQLVDRIGSINDGLRARLLVNGMDGRASLSRAVVGQLREFGIPMLNAQVKMRTAYRQAMALGATVHDLGREAKPASDEVNAVTDELLMVLEEAHGQA
jgi:chromosome partitioning protein